MFAAEFEPAMSNGRRRSPRAPVSLDARLGRGGLDRALCRVTDVSLHGARLHTYSRPAQGLDDLADPAAARPDRRDHHVGRRRSRPAASSSNRSTTAPSPPWSITGLQAAAARGLSAHRWMGWRRGWIRTHGELAPTAVFKTAALNHSATSPLKSRLVRVRSFVQGLRLLGVHVPQGLLAKSRRCGGFPTDLSRTGAALRRDPVPVRPPARPLRRTRPGFQSYLGTLQEPGRGRGGSRATLDAVMPGLTLNTRVIELDRAQPGAANNAVGVAQFRALQGAACRYGADHARGRQAYRSPARPTGADRARDRRARIDHGRDLGA